MRNRNLMPLWRLVMLAALLLSLSACGSRQPPTVHVIPADRVVEKLPNGKFSVTPAWLQERHEIERDLLQALEQCRQGKK